MNDSFELVDGRLRIMGTSENQIPGAAGATYTKERELGDITRQVLQNCAISDSRHAGLYSVCGLALRLRDLYKWEKGLEPWVETDSAKVLEWIGDREKEWEELAEKDFSDIAILGRKYDPFDAAAINALLEPHGLFYGAGYVHSLKPTFFLAVLEDKREVEGHIAYILGRELARDLLTVPALTQDSSIVIRKDSGKLFLWDQIFFVKKSARDALKFALKSHGLRQQDFKALRRDFATLFASEMETYIYHELGEIKDTIFDREIWRDIIASFPHTPVELLVRVVKDFLADTNKYGPLRHITRKRKTASLAFYVAFLDGLKKVLFPELIKAFAEFTKTGSWQLIDRAVSSGYSTARSYAEAIIDIYRFGKQNNDMKWMEEEIEKRFLTPLGIKKQHSSTSRGHQARPGP